jgi:23S rRNA pseudouridine2605 synthase
MERLQKVLARAGVASRRAAEGLIAAGRVTVNGQVVTTPGTQVDPAHDRIAVDGQPIRLETAPTTILLHKPAGYVTTVRAPWGRPTVLDLVKPGQEQGSNERLFPVGRLDADSEGLLLLTNDGELAQRLTHPRFAQEKEYLVLVEGRPEAEALRQLRAGVPLDCKLTAPALVEIARGKRGNDNTWLRFVIHEGRKRQIRRMCQAVGHAVRRLVRVREGVLVLGDLPPGQWRYLTAAEIAKLKGAESPGAGSRLAG